MKNLLVLLSLASTSVFAQTETVTVTGKKQPRVLSSFGGGSMIGDGPSGGGVNTGGTSSGGGSGKFGNEPSTAELMMLAAKELGPLLQQALSLQAYAILTAKVETAKGDKYELSLEVGFGKPTMVSKQRIK